MTQDQFIKALEQDEDDTVLRLAYSDWLEEHNFPEEADRQRKWPAAKAWLVKFCEEYNEHSEWDEIMQIKYKDLIEFAMSNDDCLVVGNNETMCDALRKYRKAIFKNLSIITGKIFDSEDHYYFSCAC